MNPTAKRYNRLSYIYDYLEAPIEYFRFASWRERIKGKVTGNRVLEVGVGTGKNFPYYPTGMNITAIDFSPRMLKRARRKADKEKIGVELIEMDVQKLSLPDNYFDTIFATFVFCSVPNPILGLKELKRVCKPDGKLLCLEHMRPSNMVLGFVFDLLNPFVVRVMGANINRRTLENIIKAGWKIREKEKLIAVAEKFGVLFPENKRDADTRPPE